MSFASTLGSGAGWLSGLWNRNRGAVGNVVKDLSPLLAFTPLGIPGAAIAGGLGEAMRPGTNFGDIVKSGASNAAIGGGARGLAGMAGFGPSAAVAGGAGGPSSLPSAPSVPRPPGGPGPSFLSQVGDKLRGVGSALTDKNNFPVLGSAASGILQAREAGQANQLKQREFDFQKQQYGDEQQRRARIAALLAPLWQQYMWNRPQVAPNPYGPSSFGSPSSAGSSAYGIG